MIELAEEVFATRNDPNQLDVDEEVLERLKSIHPATVSEYVVGDGPVAWILIFPTTSELMQRFLKNEISEKELFSLTPLHTKYDALYLCSALVLKEYRRKGIAKTLTLKAIDNIRKDHPIKSLFVWAHTKEGDLGAETAARITSLPLYKKSSKQKDK
jgi:ribosomal protein S18 acetylase RimI-like enzyme